MQRKRIMILLACFATMIGCASTGEKVEVTGKNDQLETEIKFSTFDYQRPFMGIVNPSDYFFRGYLNKATKSKTYQLYVTTNSVDWMYWDQARFIWDGKLTQRPVTRTGSDVQCSQYGCAHYEDAILNLSLDILKTWAASKEPIKVRLLSSQVSSTIDIEVNPEEVTAFLSETEKSN
jgi:hypothetical protein